ncbi:hypothetical protein [Burkholderia pseudomultivorans]|uniref:hypothetical protein n=1 Tax=Burkholderia pseudomultivorans TaxID=1207504 RepID=UPI0009C083C8|nr:hypothetical protein [Burkholderia pseudomultivorans]
MYQELIFSPFRSAKDDAYVGGGACLPADVRWPTSTSGEPLVHLMSFPGWWFDADLKDDNFWISIFIPYVIDQVGHYRKLRERDGCSEAVVVGHLASESPRNESSVEIKDVGGVVISLSGDPDDSENLASKIDGVDAWLQRPIAIPSMRRRVSVYGGDLDLALPNYRGILSDGMGYLLIDNAALKKKQAELGNFFLQLG